MVTKATSLLHRKEIHWSSIEQEAAGRYFCRVKIKKNDIYLNKSWTLKVIEPTLPSIIASNFESGHSQKHRLNNHAKLLCTFSGIPRPKISWYKINDSKFDPIANDTHFLLLEDNSILSIEHLNTGDEGKYRCVAENRAGRVFHEMELSIESE